MLASNDTRRKAFVWLSRGIQKTCPQPPDKRPYIPSNSYDHACDSMLYQMQRSDVSTYTVNPGGGSDHFLSGVADATGGIRIPSNDLDADIDRLVDDLNNYYLLGFTPADPKDTKYRNLEIQVNRPGITLRYRHGYEAAAPTQPQPPAKAAAALVSGVMPKTDLRMRASAAPLAAHANGDSPVVLSIEVHGDAARFAGPSGWMRDTLKLEVVAVESRQETIRPDSNGGTVDRVAPSMSMRGDVAVPRGHRREFAARNVSAADIREERRTRNVPAACTSSSTSPMDARLPSRSGAFSSGTRPGHGRRRRPTHRPRSAFPSRRRSIASSTRPIAFTSRARSHDRSPSRRRRHHRPGRRQGSRRPVVDHPDRGDRRAEDRHSGRLRGPRARRVPASVDGDRGINSMRSRNSASSCTEINDFGSPFYDGSPFYEIGKRTSEIITGAAARRRVTAPAPGGSRRRARRRSRVRTRASSRRR